MRADYRAIPGRARLDRALGALHAWAETFCDRHGILLTLDEVQSSFGRTGKLFAFQHFDIVPDILILGKGVASGVPVAAPLAPPELAD